jgi:hypothetical protein
VPIRESRPHGPDVALELRPPLTDGAERAAKAQSLGEKTVGHLDPPAVPDLVVEAADDRLVVVGSGHREL